MFAFQVTEEKFRAEESSELEKLIQKNKYLEEQITENYERLNYWKSLNKPNVLAVRAFRKEVTEYTKTVNTKFEGLLKEIQLNTSVIAHYRQNLDHCEKLLARAEEEIIQGDIQIKIENKRRLTVNRTKEHVLNCKVSKLEMQIQKQEDEISEMETKSFELKDIDGKYALLNAKFAIKETEFHTQCSQNEVLSNQLHQREEEVKGKKEELLNKEKILQQKEEQFKKQIQAIIAQRKFSAKIRNIFKKKTPASVENADGGKNEEECQNGIQMNGSKLTAKIRKVSKSNGAADGKADDGIKKGKSCMSRVFGRFFRRRNNNRRCDEMEDSFDMAEDVAIPCSSKSF